MSQQINLCNPLLRKKREWLSLLSVAMAVGVVLILEAAVFVWQSWERTGLQQQLSVLQAQGKQLQEETLTAGKLVSERQGNPALSREIELASLALKQREEAFQVLESSGISGTTGFAGYFQAFARQTVEGVWLTGFSITQEKMEIRGRMLDGAMLPAYIRKLNAETTFHGRRFAALDMKGVTPVAVDLPNPANPTDAKVKKPGQPYVEFVLNGVGASVVSGGRQ